MRGVARWEYVQHFPETRPRGPSGGREGGAGRWSEAVTQETPLGVHWDAGPETANAPPSEMCGETGDSQNSAPSAVPCPHPVRVEVEESGVPF